MVTVLTQWYDNLTSLNKRNVNTFWEAKKTREFSVLLFFFSCYKSLFYLVNCYILHLPKLSSKIESLFLIFLRTLYENIFLFFYLHGDMSLGACWPPARVVLVTIPGLIFFTIWECPLPYSWFESSFSWILCNLPLGPPFSFGWTWPPVAFWDRVH